MNGRESNMRCSRCGRGPEHGFTLFRSDNNRWQCASCLPQPEVLPRQLTIVFGGHNRGNRRPTS